MTSTPFPTSSATAVVAVAEQVTNDTQFVAEPTAAREASASGYPASDEQELQPTATLMPPTSLPVVESSESSMATPEAVIAMAKPERSLPTRQREQETKMRVEVTADQASDLTVVGIDAQVPDLRVQPSTTGEQIIEQEVQSSSTSLYSYLVLGLIVLGLAGWLVILSIRRRNRFISAEE
jgi:Tfp pilus assembly protein PilW